MFTIIDQHKWLFDGIGGAALLIILTGSYRLITKRYQLIKRGKPCVSKDKKDSNKINVDVKIQLFKD